MTRVSRRAVITVLALVALTSAAFAGTGSLPAPQGAAVLTLSGTIARTNADGSAQFDAAQIEALPRRSITTATPWYDGPRTFEGPLLRDVLAAVGASGRTLHVAALNDYAADLPFADALTYDVVLADRIDGKPIPVRERGPLFIMYPFDQVPQLMSEEYYQRAVWQVKSIEVKP